VLSSLMIVDRPPTEEKAERATRAYVAAVRAHYGERVKDVFLFGSRARGDFRPDSDADVAVILEDGDWSIWREKMNLAGLAYDPLVEFGLYIQPWPIARSEWGDRSRHRNSRFVENIVRDARSIMAAT
jgi:uncharacterized protein